MRQCVGLQRIQKTRVYGRGHGKPCVSSLQACAVSKDNRVNPQSGGGNGRRRAPHALGGHKHHVDVVAELCTVVLHDAQKESVRQPKRGSGLGNSTHTRTQIPPNTRHNHAKSEHAVHSQTLRKPTLTYLHAFQQEGNFDTLFSQKNIFFRATLHQCTKRH